MSKGVLSTLGIPLLVLPLCVAVGADRPCRASDGAGPGAGDRGNK